jgi:DNA replication protein DnaC
MADGDDIQSEFREADERIRAMRREVPRTPDGSLDLRALFGSIPEPSPEELAREQARREAEEERRAKVEAARVRSELMRTVEQFPVRRDLLDAIVDGSIGSTKAVEIARRWYDARSKPFLLMLGGVGCGKTVAAACLAVHAQRGERYVRVEYQKMRDVANLYRAGFGDDAKAFDRLLRTGLLIIDELTTERDADLGRAALHEIVDERSARCLPTLLLANRTKAEIRERYDARTIDRWRESAVVIELADQSMRKGAW